MKDKNRLDKIGIITKRDNDHSQEFIKKNYDYLKKNKKKIFLDKNSFSLFANEKSYSKEDILNSCDLVIVLGGDGTLLKTARSSSKKKTLVFGVNMGTLGFLTECNHIKTFDCLDKIFAGQYFIDKRALLRVTTYRKNEKIETHLALNDAVINQGAFARLIKMNLEVNNRKLVSFEADGLIVSTPTGSTAHSLSAGGPIVHPQIQGLVVNPICPKSLSMRPIILPDTRQLTITIETQRKEESALIGLTLDGQDMTILQYGDKIKFRRSKRSLYLVRVKNKYYKMLRTKLNWGI
ncbi:NAD(+)/NADH kinase [Candidatus Peregrinibacteria bacterium]|nr:NAD(+)/NADH kinase [Candidatus Peregrinibacteria bacterium]